MTSSIPRPTEHQPDDTTPTRAVAAFFLNAFLDDHEGCPAADCRHRSEDVEEAERLAHVFQQHLADHDLVIARVVP